MQTTNVVVHKTKLMDHEFSLSNDEPNILTTCTANISDSPIRMYLSY